MPRIPSSSQHTFAQAPSASVQRSSFRRNSNYKTTMNAGYLVPVYVDEVLPGDTFNLSLTSFARILSPLKFPILDNLYIDFQFWYVPMRLVYADYEKFFGSSKGPEGNWEYDDSHLIPSVTVPNFGFEIGSIADYFGLPTGVPNIRVNALPFRAYNLIVRDWYRPSSYGLDLPEVKTDSTDDDYSLYALQKRLKRADPFTAALPSPQRGPGVQLSLTGVLPVSTRNAVAGNPEDVPLAWYDTTSQSVVQPNSRALLSATMASTGIYGSQFVNRNGDDVDDYSIVGSGSGQHAVRPANLFVDMAQGQSLSINQFRQAFQLQRLLERDERSGVQYVSTLLAHFGVRSPDARLQRPEFLGGGSSPIQIHSVANTSGSGDDGRDQGSLAAFGVSAKSGVGFVKSFVEHGYVFCLASVRADNTYQQGIPKMFDRFARFDYYWPVFAHLGEEVIYNRSIYATGNAENDNGVFGYQERYWDYRYGVSKITGQLRSSFDQTLDSWHLAQNFQNTPRLNSEFLEIDVPMSRVKAVTDAPDFLYDSLISLNCVRPMPLFGIPGMVDHF